MKLALLLLTIFSLIYSSNLCAQNLEEDAVKKSDAAIGNILPSLSLINRQGKTVKLNQFRGQPLLISLVYTGCTDVCPAIIENLRPAIEIAQSALGKDRFMTITVGFDTRHDTPDRMRSFARQRGIDLPNWLFLSGSQQTIKQLADAIGFSIVPSAGGFDHMAQVSVVDSNGRIYQQIRGGVFNPPAIVEPLKDLMFNQRRSLFSVSGIADRIKVFCTVYNPNTGRYYFNYSLFIGMGIGVACLLLILYWLIREFKLSSRPGRDSIV